MELNRNEIIKKLEKIAWEKSIGFCYLCYEKAPAEVCPSCGSDDLMRHLDSVGCEYGLAWVYNQLIDEALTPVDTEEIFESMVEECYPEETKVGWICFDTVDAMKTLDPTSWDLAKDEYIDGLVSDEELITFDEVNYYWKFEIENYIKENLKEVA